MPRFGHFKRAQRIYGYLRRFPDGAICFRTNIPEYAPPPEHSTFDWTYTVYGEPEEELPQDMPPPKGKVVRITTFKDANLMHDLITGRSTTGILHFVNQTPVDWFSKLQQQLRQLHMEVSLLLGELLWNKLLT